MRASSPRVIFTLRSGRGLLNAKGEATFSLGLAMCFRAGTCVDVYDCEVGIKCALQNTQPYIGAVCDIVRYDSD